MISKPTPEVLPKYNAEDQHTLSLALNRNLTEDSLMLELVSPKLIELKQSHTNPALLD